jgi:uncharacterized protein (TIGR04222 family)
VRKTGDVASSRGLDPGENAGLGYGAYAYLRHGEHAAMVAVLASLYAGGLITAGRPGTVRKAGDEPHLDDPTARVVLAALHGSVSPAGLRERPPIRRAFAELDDELVRAGLLRSRSGTYARRAVAALMTFTGAFMVGWPGPAAPTLLGIVVVMLGLLLWFRPRRITRAGRLALAAETAPHKWPLAMTSVTPDTATEVGWAVAVHGPEAVSVLMPRFAKDAALLKRSASDDMTGAEARGGNGLPNV